MPALLIPGGNGLQRHLGGAIAGPTSDSEGPVPRPGRKVEETEKDVCAHKKAPAVAGAQALVPWRCGEGWGQGCWRRCSHFCSKLDMNAPPEGLGAEDRGPEPPEPPLPPLPLPPPLLDPEAPPVVAK